MNKYGLTEKEQVEILAMFKKYTEIDEVILFGSRAMNTFTKISDIDFALKGDNISRIIGSLVSDFEDSSLIYEVDVIDYHGISSEALLEHIRKYGKVFYRKGWVETTLGEHIKIKHGFAFKGEFITEQPTNKILVTPGNFLIGGGFKSDKFKYFLGNVPNEYILRHRDVIITMTDLSKKGDTLGYPALVPKSGSIVYLHNQRIGLVELIGKSINKNFLYWLFRTRVYQKNIVNSSTGSTVRHTSPSRIQEYSFHLPPLPEQKAIAAVLSAFDDKIELLREQNQTLETLGQTIFKEWFVHFNFPDKDGKPYRDNGGEMVDSELGKIPKGWRVGGIRPLVRHIKNSIKPFENKEYFHYSLPVFDSGKWPEKQIGGEIKSSKYQVEENCFLVSKLNPSTPRVWVIFEPLDNSICSTEFQVIKPLKFKFFGFVYGALTSYIMIHELSARAHGTSSSHQRVKPEDILDCSIFFPPNDLIEKYSEITNTMLKKASENIRQIQTLSKTRDTLLPKLMSGQTRVKGFEQ